MAAGRIAAGAALLLLLYWWGVIDLGALKGITARPLLLALAIAAAFAVIPLEALRWHVLLRSQGFAIRLWPTTRIMAVAQFFSNFLPGAAGGDLIRGVFIYKAAAGRRAAALLSILVDRLIGFVAFVLLGSAALLLRPNGHFGWFDEAVIGFSAAYMAALLGLFLYAPVLARWTRRLLPRRSTRIAAVIDDLGLACRHYARDWRSAGLALLLSAAVVFACIVPIVAVAAAMPWGGVGLLDYFAAGLYAFLANSLPLTPGGLGLGETAFASAAAMLAPKTAGAAFGTIFLAYRCVFIVATLPGLAAYAARPSVTR